MNISQLSREHFLSPMHRYIKHIHFVGIGGIGMSGLAIVLANEGYRISGSDLVSNKIIDHLITLGAKIYFNHHAENINNANLIVVSSAVPKNNPELIAAQKYYIPIISRAEMLAEIMRFRYGIAISGTHGKTTTTSMIVSIYEDAGLNPTFISGGFIKRLGNANLGNSAYFITEADESDASFLYLQPIVSIVTNIEADHMDTYKGNFEELKNSFIKFIHNLPFYGRVIMCLDDRVIRDLISSIKRKVITYGFTNDADIYITEYKQEGRKVNFCLIVKDQDIMHVTLNQPGYHNALNATAAIATALEEGIDNKIILRSLENFQGIARRFDILGEFKTNSINGIDGSVILIEDYGHHPTEIEATIKAVREGWPEKKLIMIFQPHRYTRTRDLFSEFVNVLEKVNILLILEVYSAGENYIPGADSLSLCQKISNNGKITPIFLSDQNLITTILAEILSGNDIILVQGAGNIDKIAHRLANVILSPINSPE